MEIKEKTNGKPSKSGVKTYIRSGLPQGLTISPVLSTLTLEDGEESPSIMYADDGVFIGNKFEDFRKGAEKKLLTGAEVNKAKSSFVKEKFEFLGVEINIKEQTVSYKLNRMNGDDPKLMDGLRTIVSKYSERKNKGKGDIKLGSYLNSTRIPKTGNWGDLDMILINSMKGMSYKGYRMFKLGFGIQDIPGSSSLCLEELIKDLEELNLVGIPPFQKVFRSKVIKQSIEDQLSDTFYIQMNRLKTKKTIITKRVGNKVYKEILQKSINFNQPTLVKAEGDEDYDEVE